MAFPISGIIASQAVVCILCWQWYRNPKYPQSEYDYPLQLGTRTASGSRQYQHDRDKSE